MGAASTHRGDAVIRRQADAAVGAAVARMERPARERETPPPSPGKGSPTRGAIARWMRANAAAYTDPKTSEINMTAMVEGWDAAEADGGATMDSDHPAWEVAAEVAEKLGGLR